MSLVATEPPSTEPPSTEPRVAPSPPTTIPITTIPTTPPATSPTSIATGPGSRLPNGVAIGALVTFDGAAIRLQGALPNAAAHDRLTAFVTAANVNGKPIVNEVAVDPRVPGGDSVRFVGLHPLAFPEGTDDTYPPHAAELDRIADLLNAFPDVTVVVLGRADRRGRPNATSASPSVAPPRSSRTSRSTASTPDA